MKVVVAGATGFIGTRVVAALRARGDEVVALVRDLGRAAARLPGVTAHAWDAAKEPVPRAALSGADAVVNLVGEPVGRLLWTARWKEQMRVSRVHGARAIVDALADLHPRPRVVVAASGTGYYGARGDELLTESSSTGQGYFAELSRAWEAESIRARELGVRVAVVRSGVVLSARGGMLAKLLPLFRVGVGGRVGDGRQWMPWIHLDDEVGLILKLLDTDSASGPFNAVAPEPVTNAEFVRALGEVLGRPTVMAAPAFVLRMVLRELATELLLTSQRAVPVRALEIGFTFSHPLLRGALADLLPVATASTSRPAPGSRPRPPA